METSKEHIVEKAAQMIMQSGVEALTLNRLSAELDLKKNPSAIHLAKEEDLLLLIAEKMETDIHTFIKGLSQSRENPDAELSILFKKLYFFFLQKPYYLDILFDEKNWTENPEIKAVLTQMKNRAENYLTSVIERGKMKTIFKTKSSTQALVEHILSGFRIFMQDEQQLNEMIQELKH